MRGTVDVVTTDLTAADRPIPDDADLRLITELINNVSIPLANAAWNAQMSQAEAALRLVSMAERGLPLRLVADGDRTALWHLAQAGPVQPVAAPAPEVATAVTPVPEPEPEVAVVPVPEPVVAVAPIPEPAVPAVGTGVPAALAEAGDIPPVADPALSPDAPPESAIAPETPPAPEPAIAPEPAADAAVTPVPEPATPPVPAHAAPDWAVHPITGPAGERLTVTIVQFSDPAGAPVEIGGAPLAPGYRAVLVRSRVANIGQLPYPAGADANLVLETDQRVLIGRAGPPPADYPGFGPGIAPGETVEGWSLFAVPESTVLAGIKWCIRPDFPGTIVGWPIER